MRFPSDLLPQLWLNALREVEQPAAETVKDWLSGSAYAVSTPPAARTFTVVIHDEGQLCEKLAIEINKWASASFETVAAISPKSINKHAIAWPLIQAYYAAFFAAHAIMRSFGSLCSQLDAGHTSGIIRSCIASGITPTANINSGFYRLRYDRSLGALIGDLMDDSHADTWRTFSSLVDQLSTDVLAVSGVSTAKTMASDLLDKLNNVLTYNGANQRGNWLSQFRNQVNYQKSFGVWYPYQKGNPTLTDMLHLLDRWRNRKANFEFDTGQSDVCRFIEATTFIIWIARELLLRLSESRARDDHFLDRGGLDFLRFAKWHK